MLSMQPLLGLSNKKGVDPYNFNVEEDFNPEVVANSLSNLCRYAGHYGWISVAEHSLIVSLIMRQRWKDSFSSAPEFSWPLAGLLHDAFESIFTDIPKPVKDHPAFAFLREKENSYLERLYLLHGIQPTRDLLENIDAADKFAVSVELDHLGQHGNPLWFDFVDMWDREKYHHVMALGVGPQHTKDVWLKAYYSLTGRF